jgi:hypothetical protein
VTEPTGGLGHRLRRAGRAVVASLFSDGPAFPERVQHHLVAFEIEEGDTIAEILAIRSHGSVYNFSNYVSQGKRTVSLPTDRGKRVIKSSRIVGVTIIESWKGTPPKRTFDSYGDVFERHGWTERTAYPGVEGD